VRPHSTLCDLRVLVRGAGEMASGIAHRLFRSHLRVALTEVARPLAVRRTVSFCEAVWDGTCTVDGVAVTVKGKVITGRKGTQYSVTCKGDGVKVKLKGALVDAATGTQRVIGVHEQRPRIVRFSGDGCGGRIFACCLTARCTCVVGAAASRSRVHPLHFVLGYVMVWLSFNGLRTGR